MGHNMMAKSLFEATCHRHRMSCLNRRPLAQRLCQEAVFFFSARLALLRGAGVVEPNAHYVAYWKD